MNSNKEKTLGETVLSLLEKETIIERSGWPAETVVRVTKALQSVRTEKDEFEVVVYWASSVSAFTMPGHHIFFSRRLLERCRNDSMVAFVIAHEISHHDLGHLDQFPSWVKPLAKFRSGRFLREVAKTIERILHGPERECEADRHALQLCHLAGYDLTECLKVFDVLASHQLDMRNLHLTFGTDTELDEKLSPNPRTLTKVRNWAWTRRVGYLSVEERKSRLLDYAKELTAEREPSGSLSRSFHNVRSQGNEIDHLLQPTS